MDYGDLVKVTKNGVVDLLIQKKDRIVGKLTAKIYLCADGISSGGGGISKPLNGLFGLKIGDKAKGCDLDFRSDTAHQNNGVLAA